MAAGLPALINGAGLSATHGRVQGCCSCNELDPDRIGTSKKKPPATYPGSSSFTAALAGVLGIVAAGLITATCAQWSNVSNREGAAGSRTDTRWWHGYVMRGEVRFLQGRIRFEGGKHCAPFPSAFAIFRPPQFRLLSA